MEKPDFIAILHYCTTESGGRSTPVFSKYRPHIKFSFSDYQTSGEQIFIGKDIVYPGETIKAEIRIIATDYFKGKLSIGLDFIFSEGSKVIGTGKILEVVNQHLIEE